LRSQPQQAREHAREMKSGSTRGFNYQLLALVGWTSAFWLRDLRQPTLILSGQDDPIIRVSNARLLHQLIPRSELYLYNDGHLGLLTSAGELAPVVRRFLGEEMVGQAPRR
jgi:pimeloyl-ACP methyl ester carboxylesterase